MPKSVVDDYELAFDIDFNNELERAQVTEIPRQSVDSDIFSQDEDRDTRQLFGQFEDVFQEDQELEQLDVEESKRDSGYPHQINPYSQVRYDDYEAPVHSLPVVKPHHTHPHPTAHPTAETYDYPPHPSPPYHDDIVHPPPHPVVHPT